MILIPPPVSPRSHACGCPVPCQQGSPSGRRAALRAGISCDIYPAAPSGLRAPCSLPTPAPPALDRTGLSSRAPVVGGSPPSVTARGNRTVKTLPSRGCTPKPQKIPSLRDLVPQGTDSESLWSQASQHQHVSGPLSRLIASCRPTMRGAMASVLLPTDTFRFLIGGTRASVGFISGYLLKEIPRTFRYRHT